MNKLTGSVDFTSTKNDFDALTKIVNESNDSINVNRAKLAELEKQQKSGAIVGDDYRNSLTAINGQHKELTDNLDEARFKLFDLNQKGLQPIIPIIEKIRASFAANPNDITIFDRIEKDLLAAERATRDARVLSDIFAATAEEKGAATPKALEDARRKLNAAKQSKNVLDIEFDNRERERYAGSLEGLRQRVKDLQNDEVTRAFVVREANKGLYSELGSLISENITLESKFYQNAELLAERRKNKLLQYERDIFEIREELNQKSVFSSVEAQAKILDHLNRNVKSTTDIFADSFIDAFDRIAGYSDKLLDKSGIGKIPILGDIAKAQSKNALSNITRGLMDNIFPNLSKELEKAENPALSEAKEQTKELKSINAKLGGSTLTGGFVNGGKPFGNILQSIGLGSQPDGGKWGTGGGLFSGASQNNPLIYHASDGGSRVPPTGTINANGEFVVNGNERSGGILSQIKSVFGTGEGGLFAARKNLLNGKMSGAGGMAGGIGSLAMMAGGLIGGRAGGVLSMAGMGAQYGSMFGLPGALVGAGAGALIGFLKGRGGDSKKKLKSAVQSAYGISINDDSVLKQIENIGKAYFGTIAGRESQVVTLEEVRNIVESYASRNGQSTRKLNAQNFGNENWSGNQFGTKFSGFQSPQSTLSAIIRQPRPELYAPVNYGSASVNAGANATNQTARDDREQLNANMMETLISAVGELRAAMQIKSPGDLVVLGAQQRPDAIADAYERELDRSPSRTEAFYRKTGQAF